MSSEDVGVQSNIWSTNSVLRQKRENPGKQNYMPFLFRSKRQFQLTADKSQSPPVGTYSISSCMGKTSGIGMGMSNEQLNFLNTKLLTQNQMIAFKSKQNRFANPNNCTLPGPTAYEKNEGCGSPKNNNKLKQLVMNSKKKQQQLFSMTQKNTSCPAIPTPQVRYGYMKDSTGKYKVIQKSEQQIQNDKQRLRNYCSTLVGQRDYTNYPGIYPFINENKEIVSRLQKFVDKTNTVQTKPTSVQKGLKKVRPYVKLSRGIVPQKSNQQNLGPGCYRNSLDTLKKSLKNEKFQFFGSSQKRFTQIQKRYTDQANSHQNVALKKSHYLLNHRNQPKYAGKRYKGSFNTSTEPNLIQKQELPGPGSYQPNSQPCKKSYGNVRFGNQPRFKQTIIVIEEQEVSSLQLNKNISSNPGNSESQWGSLRKEKIKSPHKEFAPSKEEQIIGVVNSELKSQLQRKKKIRSSIKKSEKGALNLSSASFRDKTERYNTPGSRVTNNENIRGHLGPQDKKRQGTSPNSSTMEPKIGSYISKLDRPDNMLAHKQNTPGPGTYQQSVMMNLAKKSFNIKK